MNTHVAGDERYIIMNRHDIYDGFLRAKVTEVDIEDNEYGAIRVFIPDLMIDGIEPNFDENGEYGIIAYPGNNPIGGYNESGSDDCMFQSSVNVPLKGSWIWVWFEGGLTGQNCFYGNSFQFKQAKTPPENRNVDEPHKVHTMIKTISGRSIIVCDSTDQARIEITGKRRVLTGETDPKTEPRNPPYGEEYPDGKIYKTKPTDSTNVKYISTVYDIDQNMTTILLDERENKQKLLIRTYKGDFIHIDIDEQSLQAYFKNDINIKSGGTISLYGEKGVNIKSDSDVKVEAKNEIHTTSKNTYMYQSGGFYLLSKLINKLYGSKGTKLQSKPKPPQAEVAEFTEPKGDRDT